MRILVTGPRDWSDRSAVWDAIEDTLLSVYGSRATLDLAIFHDDVTIVNGGAKGADSLSSEAARIHGLRTEVHRADWNAHGNAAGGIRNQEMVDAGADVCIAFLLSCRNAKCKRPMPHWTHGTTDCVTRAKAAGIPVMPVRGFPA